jgi:hypothetical protein
MLAISSGGPRRLSGLSRIRATWSSSRLRLRNSASRRSLCSSRFFPMAPTTTAVTADSLDEAHHHHCPAQIEIQHVFPLVSEAPTYAAVFLSLFPTLPTSPLHDYMES